MEQTLGHELPDAAVLAFREIDNFRPLLLVPAWIDGVLERTCPQPAVRKRVEAALGPPGRGAARQPSSSASATPSSSANLVDGLSRALRFSKRRSTGWAAATLQWLQDAARRRERFVGCHALSEPDFRNRRARHVVYGHTHAAEIVPLDASHAEGYVLEQVYFNAGTWRRTFRPARLRALGTGVHRQRRLQLPGLLPGRRAQGADRTRPGPARSGTRRASG